MGKVLCPKCRRPVEASGEVVVDGGPTLPVFQCEHCVVPWQLEGETFDAALSFAVTADGNLLNTESLAPLALY